MTNSIYFSRLKRGLAHQRAALLKDSNRNLIYPAYGTPWVPTRFQQSSADAFIFFFVAELETYFEEVLGVLLDFHEKYSINSESSRLGAHDKMHEQILGMKRDLAKNNNTRWTRISKFWKFVGISKQYFPRDFWDHVDQISTYRGDVAHKSWGIRSFTDPRIVFQHVEILIPLISLFDRDFLDCAARQEAELARISVVRTEFVPGLGILNTNSF